MEIPVTYTDRHALVEVKGKTRQSKRERKSKPYWKQEVSNKKGPLAHISVLTIAVGGSGIRRIFDGEIR